MILDGKVCLELIRCNFNSISIGNEKYVICIYVNEIWKKNNFLNMFIFVN